MIIRNATSTGKGIILIKDGKYSGPIQTKALSNNQWPSSGICFLHEDQSFYLPNWAGDIKETLGLFKNCIKTMNDTLQKTAQSVSNIQATVVPIPNTPNANISIVPPTIQADLASVLADIETINTKIKVLKNLLK